MAEIIFFRSDTLGPFPCLTTRDGKIDLVALGQKFKLDPKSIELCDITLPRTKDNKTESKWKELRKIFGKAGTAADPVTVGGDAVLEARTGENLRENQAKRLKHADTREVDVGEGLWRGKVSSPGVVPNPVPGAENLETRPHPATELFHRICDAVGKTLEPSSVFADPKTYVKLPFPSVAGSLSWEKWLRQQLPPLTLGTCSSVPGFRSSKDEYILAPASTVEWPNFWPDVNRYLELAANKHSHHKRIDIDDSVKCRRVTSEADCVFVYSLLLTKICGTLFGDKFILEQTPPLSSRRQYLTTNRPGALNNPSADVHNAMQIATRTVFPDVILKYENRGFVVVEMKKPFFFRTRIENSIPDLLKAYGERCNPFLDGQRYPVPAQSVEQLFMYLNACGIGYGIISSADLSYFLRRVGDTLYISQGVEWQNPKFVAALSYFLEEAQRDTPANAFREEWKRAAGSSEGLIDDSEDSAVSDHDLGFVPKNFTITGTDRRSTRSMHVDPCSTLGAGSDLKETPVERLNLDSHPFARGWSGNIVRGTYEGVPVAVKLALVGTDRAEALLNEASAYLRLQNCWGTYTPALVSHGTTAFGHLVYIATELIEGLELGMGTLTPEVVEASFEALHAIHGFGLLHGDVRPANILVPRTGWQGVRFIDFGFSRSIATDMDCRKELQELLGIVRQWYPCTRASPPPGQVAVLAGNQSRQAVF